MGEETSYDSALQTVNTSIMFLVLLVLGILLSLKGVLLQRDSLCVLREGGDAEAPESPELFQCAAGAISIGALGYFFTLALQGWNDACREGSARAETVSRTNLWASLLVLCAAILRLWALRAGQEVELPQVEEDLPA